MSQEVECYDSLPPPEKKNNSIKQFMIIKMVA